MGTEEAEGKSKKIVYDSCQVLTMKYISLLLDKATVLDLRFKVGYITVHSSYERENHWRRTE